MKPGIHQYKLPKNTFPPPKIAQVQQEPPCQTEPEPDENMDSSNLIEEVYLKNSEGLTREELDRQMVDDTYLDDFLQSKPFKA